MKRNEYGPWRERPWEEQPATWVDGVVFLFGWIVLGFAVTYLIYHLAGAA